MKIAIGLAALCGGLLFGAAPARAAQCTNIQQLVVTGAQQQVVNCFDDLSTRYLVSVGRTDAGEWGALHSQRTRNPPAIVPGIQVDGHFSDSSTFNPTHGWARDSQFVIRLPDTWNGKLVITGAPGNSRQYANDFFFSDWLLARGYAYASTDKGNSSSEFHRDGASPGDAMAEWNQRLTELTLAAKGVVKQRYGRLPGYTYLTGISHGGYLVRHALENRPDLYDGGVDWSGTHWRAQAAGPNLFTFLPVALKHYPRWIAQGDPVSRQAILDAGFSAGTEFLWEHHYRNYWDLLQRTHREELDPNFDGSLEAGAAFCASGAPGCDADYNWAARSTVAASAVSKIALTGRISKPLVSLHGSLDALLPIGPNGDAYAALVQSAGRGKFHRYYVIETGTHIDRLTDDYPDRLRPMAPCHRAAFVELERWVEVKGAKPPESRTVARPQIGDLANTCPL